MSERERRQRRSGVSFATVDGGPVSVDEQEHRRFVRVVMGASLGAVLLITIALGAFSHRLATAELIEVAEHRNVLTARAMVERVAAELGAALAVHRRPAGDTAEGDAAVRRLATAVAAYPLGASVAGVTIYDAAGDAVYSSVPAGGAGDGRTEPVFEAARGGRVASVLVADGMAASGDAPADEGAVVVTYVPVEGLRAVVGVHEDVTPWLRSSRRSQRALVLAVLAGLAGLYGVLAVAVRWADAVMSRTAARQRRSEEGRAVLERELRHRQRMQAVGTLAAGIAHDFNNILWAIQSCSDLILREVPADGPLREKAQEIADAARAGANLVRQMVSFSRRKGQWRQAIDVRAAVEEALERVMATRPPGVEVHQRLEDCGVLAAAPGELQQLAGNLVRNAVQAVQGGGGRVEVTLAAVDVGADARDVLATLAPGRWVRLSVRDTGQGMDDATLDRIFDPFFSTKDVGEGVGLGLAIVHGIVSDLDGIVRVQSEPGQGSVFDLFLPQRQAVADVAAPSDPDD